MKILIGSCGGLTGLYLAKVLRKMDIGERFEIYGFDITTKVPTKFFLDKLFVISRSSEEKEFIDQLIEILNKERIDIYIPVHSEECRVVSKYQTEILKRSRSKFMISPYETFKMLDNKANAYKILKGIGLKTPKIYTSYHDVDEFPVVVKPAVGSGSRGFFICRNREELELATTIYRDALIMEYIDGKEYTVDAFFNKKGELVTYNQRIRIKTLGGAAVISENDFSIDVRDQIEKIAAKCKIFGPANFQFFLTPENEVIFTDINLRFASGGLPLSVESGSNIVKLLILELLGKPYNPSEFQSDRKKRIMYRYFEEMFEVTEG
ncbi:hypothetical protein LA10_09699 [Thermotoga neapolitana LA10]|uniref:ATP-grasp domain-containing protein n=1 Tax=Thermotoga sp. 38H-to TaxID=1755812 RepID=UPI000280E896|nr:MULTISPECIES: ATP-grasp domain-containing protein [Thermotoga]AIY85720.1 hypothetical protein T2812B_00845 [Thermotoga sp. 2812B]EJX26471.1 hypothetical protein EMP_01949 [Thermotoga sp. EMP]KFZ20791.1 hypothetical protein LA10_09699 [Thermotoga neapolitana LA10]